MTPAHTPQQARSDAVRNRARIMDAAREQIEQHGPGVGMTTIADAAGVAVGTLYRNFPSKADLVNAVTAEHLDGLVDDIERTAARVAKGSAPGPALRRLLGRILDEAARNHAIKEAANSLGAQDFSAAEERALGPLAELIKACIRAGDLAPNVRPADFQLLMVTAPVDQPTATRRRWLQIYLAGLAPRS